MKKIFITGGAGYVGSELTIKLVNLGYIVTVYDLFIYGDNIPDNKNLKKVKGDIRDKELLEKSIQGNDVVIQHHSVCS